MTDRDPKVLAALNEICNAFLDSIREAGPEGIDGGKLYAASMNAMDLGTFETFMLVLVNAEKIEKRGDRYYPTMADLEL